MSNKIPYCTSRCSERPVQITRGGNTRSGKDSWDTKL